MRAGFRNFAKGSRPESTPCGIGKTLLIALILNAWRKARPVAVCPCWQEETKGKANKNWRNNRLRCHRRKEVRCHPSAIPSLTHGERHEKLQTQRPSGCIRLSHGKRSRGRH
nr:hypothetical protein SHINE37_70262 [Rhizobiaceae bacterium]